MQGARKTHTYRPTPWSHRIRRERSIASYRHISWQQKQEMHFP